MKKLLVYTDGAARGNPGLAGAGVIIKDESGQTLASLKKFLGVRTNNEAEYEAVFLALDWLESNVSLGAEVHFYFDSLLLTEQLAGNWKIKASNLKPLLEKIKRRIIALNLKVKFNHLSREENKMADFLANQALDERENIQAGI